MNDLKIDKLFHDKLRSLEVSPSKEAWNSIEENLHSKKSGSWFWLYSIAASIVIIIGAFILFNEFGKAGTKESLIVENRSTPNAESSEISDLNALPPTQKNIQAEKSNVGSTRLVEPEIIIEEQHANVASSKMMTSKNRIEEPVVKTRETNSLHSSDISIIEKQLPEIDNTYARIEPDFHFIPETYSDLALPENESEIKKIYDYAVRVKNGEETLIDLRKAKEDLFAMAKNIKINQSKTN